MTRFSLKTIAVAAAVSVGALAMAPQPAEARRALPLIAGIVIGAAIAGAFASDRKHRNRGYYYAAPAPSYRHGGWDDAHEYCASRFRSYDPYTRSYQPYHGPRRPCP